MRVADGQEILARTGKAGNWKRTPMPLLNNTRGGRTIRRRTSRRVRIVLKCQINGTASVGTIPYIEGDRTCPIPALLQVAPLVETTLLESELTKVRDCISQETQEEKQTLPLNPRRHIVPHPS